jgi:hypothetical protein
MAKPARIRIDDEPRFSEPMTKLDLMHTLNWYHQNKESRDALNYINLYTKKNKIQGKIDTSNGILTVGWLCRLVLNGNDIGDKGRAYIKKNLFFIDDTPAPVVVVDKGPSIQDRLNEKISEIAGDLEGAIDEVVISKFNTMPSPFAIMQDRAKGMHANKLVDIFKKRRSEFDDVLNTKDADVREGYSNFTKPQLKKLVAYCDTIITDAMKIAGEAKINRKPRKRKAKTPDQLVSKVQYCEKFDDLKLVSIKPKDIIGAMQLWVFNTKTRKLGVYHADDAGGFSVKGTTITNYTESKSISKTVRKPDQTLPELLKAGKIALRNVLAGIATKESLLNGRINSDIVLLRVL